MPEEGPLFPQTAGTEVSRPAPCAGGRRMLDDRSLDVILEVDGGITLGNIGAVKEAGADLFVAGSAIFLSENYGETIGKMRTILDG